MSMAFGKLNIVKIENVRAYDGRLAKVQISAYKPGAPAVRLCTADLDLDEDTSHIDGAYLAGIIKDFQNGRFPT